MRAFLVSAFHDVFVVAHGERMDPSSMDGVVAIHDGRMVGHAAYRIAGDSCELVAIAASPRSTGIGSRLLDSVIQAAKASGAGEVWLTTTNDNLDALRFYQRRGFRLRTIRPGAVDEARRELKPSLPHVGSYGIPMRDELHLVRTLADESDQSSR